MRVLIVHGWEGKAYREWVERLADALQTEGLEVVLDPGSDGITITVDPAKLATLEAAVRDAERVVVLCSPNYRHKASWGKEWSQIVARLPGERLVPVLTRGTPDEAMPVFLEDAEALDLSRPAGFGAAYGQLLYRLGVEPGWSDASATGPGPEGPSLRPPPGPQDAGEPLNGLGDPGPGAPAGSGSPRRAARRVSLRRNTVRSPKTGNVQVTTVVPGGVEPGARFKVEVVLHVEGFEVEAGDDQRVDANVAALPLAEGAQLTVRLVSVDADIFAIDDPEAPLVWGPPARRADFRLRAAKELDDGVYDLRAEYWCEGVQLARSYLEVAVGRGSRLDAGPKRTGHRPLPRSAFASYSRRDRVDVARRVDSLKTWGIDVFLDSLDIRQGTDWQQVLEDELLSRDALLLFWSRAASESEWVEKEWRFALEHRGLESILPNALETPDVTPPPPELKGLEFGSVLTELAEFWRWKAERQAEG